MKKSSNLIGKHVIVRSNLAGIFFGILQEKKGNELTLINARKIYYFSGANTVEDIATSGCKNINNSKITTLVDIIELSDYVQILPCTNESITNLNSIPIWKY